MRVFRITDGIAFSRKALRWLVGGWSLHRKSLLFLGVALIVPIGLAFWFLLQVVDDLVMQTTRQTAHDYARSVVAWKHVENKEFNKLRANSQTPAMPTYFEPDVYDSLSDQLVGNPDYRDKLIMLDTVAAHDNLFTAASPASDEERKLLEQLEQRYRQVLANSATPRIDSEADPQDNPEKVDAVKPVDPPGRGDLFEEIKEPVFDPQEEIEGGWYTYYHVIQFHENCMQCHKRYETQPSAAEIPFCVARIRIPYSQTLLTVTPTVSLMIAIAIITVAITLAFVHWVFRNIVLNPLNHLRTVSDEISRGNIYLRANIDTGDEFNELGDAFNRMLRHMTEGQSKLRELNYELDLKIDQLAQANLQLYEANRLKSDFLANMSHELRTPLNSILGFSDVLQGIELLNDKQRKYVSNIQSSGRVLLEMINEILDLAKMEAGKMKVSPVSFDLPHLVQSQCNMLQSLLDEKNMDLQIEFASEMPSVFQDQAKIQQILTNLLSNAIKFTPDGGLITVQVGLASEHVFFLTVTDTGVGIPESDFEIIFEKFRQSRFTSQEDGLTRQYSGTGLGLSIVKELCRLLGGEIHLTSQLGTGSSFRVLLPVNYDPVRNSQSNSDS